VRSEAGGVVTLTISRPPANAFDNVTINRLRSLLEEIDKQGCGVRSVIITGSGSRFFSAGGDVKELDGMTEKEGIARIRDFHAVLVLLERLEAPVACAVNGDAVGGGTEICLFADYRVGVANARFGLPEVNHGLLPAARSVQQAVRVLGLREARRLLFEGRLIGAEEAVRIGLIDGVARDGEELAWLIRRWADDMARKPRLLLGSLKRTMALAGRLTEEEQYEMMISDFRRYFSDEEVRGRMRELIDRWKRPQKDRLK
jgi:enoyl-CoA hydratase/carnithine racemase